MIPFIAVLNTCGLSQDYSQSYVIVINHVKVGKEIINEKINFKGDLVCISEQERDTYDSKEKKRRIIRTKIVLPEGKLFPVSYSYESSAGISYDVKVKDGQIIQMRQKEGESRETITPLEPGMLMFDMNAFHTISYWIRNYDDNKGRNQVFQTYFPNTASIGQISITADEIVIPEHETKELQLRNYEIEIGDRLRMLLWVDKDNHLYRMFVQGLNLEVIRTDLFDRLNKKMNQKEG